MIDINWLVSKSGVNGIKYVCGREYGNNTIKGVHIMDNPDTYKFFKAGEIILTTGYVFKQMKNNEIAEMIKSMRDRECSGIAFKIHRYYDRVPEIIVKEAIKRSIPILEIPFELALSDLQLIIFREIFNQEKHSEDTKNHESVSFFDKFFDKNISRMELELLCTENWFSTKNQYSIIVYEEKDYEKQKIIIDRESFLRKITCRTFTRNGNFAVIVDASGAWDNFEMTEYIREFALECSEAMDVIGGENGIDFGISSIGSFYDISTLFLQATKAKMVNCLLGDIRAVTYEEQKIYHFLMENIGIEGLKQMVMPIITKLEPDLLLTLEELVLFGWKYKETADKLFLHRNTLLFRKEKIFSALGISDNACQITYLEMCVYAYRILKHINKVI